MSLTGWLAAFSKWRTIERYRIPSRIEPKDALWVDIQVKGKKYRTKVLRKLEYKHSEADDIDVLQRYLTLKEYVSLLNLKLLIPGQYREYFGEDHPQLANDLTEPED